MECVITWKRRGRRLLIPCAAVLALLCGGCARQPLLRQWQRPEAGVFVFADRDLSLQCRLENRHVAWVFKNHAFIPMTILENEIALRIEGDPVAYTLWGGNRDDFPAASPLLIKPNGFISFDFPVRFKGPIFPLRVTSEKRVYLELIARWGRAVIPYRIAFPMDEHGAASDPDEQK